VAKRLTTWILIGLVLGIAVGWLLNAFAEPLRRFFVSLGWVDPATDAPAFLKALAGYISIVSQLFLRLIKMIIAPLVFATLVQGIVHMGDTAALGRVGGRAILWFLTASLVSLSLGLLLVNLLQPGVGLGFPVPAADAASGVDRAKFGVAEFITHIVPTSGIDAMARNEILQIVVFALFIGVAITAVGTKAAPIARAIDGLVDVMLTVTGYVMRFAPFAVFAAVTATLAERGPSVIGDLAYFMGTFYLGLILLWLLLIGACFLIIGPRTGQLIRYIREPILLAFSTSSSEAAYPRTLEALDRFGVPPRIASFVLPLGYSFNLDGSMLYMTFASIFIAQAYGIDLSLGTMIAMLLVLMITSKGVAGVPRASLVVISATLTMFGIPEAGLLLILGVDHFLDMGRSATNVVGNAVAAAVVAKWEGGRLDAPEPAEIDPPHAPAHAPPLPAGAHDSFRD